MQSPRGGGAPVASPLTTFPSENGGTMDERKSHCETRLQAQFEFHKKRAAFRLIE